ncbi:hypothetical protein HK405_004342, partial [Cladochytrium tenue]
MSAARRPHNRRPAAQHDTTAAERAAASLAAGLRRSLVVHDHIVPAFARRVPVSPGSTSSGEDSDGDGGGDDDDTDTIGPGLKSEDGSWGDDTGRGRSGTREQPGGDARRPSTDGSGETARFQSDGKKVRSHPDNQVPPRWIKDVPAVSRSEDPDDGQRPFPLRIEIRHDVPQPLQTTTTTTHHPPPPACQRIVLRSPAVDPFYHWTFRCHRYSVRSLAVRHGWAASADDGRRRRPRESLPESAAAPGAGTYATDADAEAFVVLFKDLVRACMNQPQRYTASLQSCSHPAVVALRFSETVSGYRRVHLLEVEFSPSLWDDVVQDLRGDYARLARHRADLKSALVEYLDLVCRRHPALLLSGGVPDPLQPAQTRPWSELVADLVPTSAQELDAVRNGARRVSDRERTTRKKMFVLLAGPDAEDLE